MTDLLTAHATSQPDKLVAANDRRDGNISKLTDDGGVTCARDHLARHKAPRSISWMDEPHKTGAGTVLKRKLRQPLWAGHASDV